MRWSEPVVLAACAVAALVVSMACTAWAIAYARRCGMLDQPGERRSHATATPRGGGIGIAVALLLAMCLLGGWVDAGWWPIAGGLLLVAGVGWGDDHRPLPIALRLGAHALAGVALAWGLHLQDAGLPAVLAALVLVPVLVNAWNFMDGIDGLATSQALLCAAALASLLGGGWQVLCATGPEQALEIAASDGDGIRLILSDVVMPGMNGRELVERLTKRWPGLAHLLMSGYTADAISRGGVLEGAWNFIEKPFGAVDLLERIAAILGSPPR